MHETLVILMHSFNSLLWNLAPASLIMVRLKPHLQQQQRQSSVWCTHWLPGPVCAQCTQHRRLCTEFQKALFTFHSSPQLICQESFPLDLSSQERKNALFHDSGMRMQSWTFQELGVCRLQCASDCLVLLKREKKRHKLGAALAQAFNVEQPATTKLSPQSTQPHRYFHFQRQLFNLKISS